ncbi:preprotein translocase subunit YajC [Arcobacter sp. FWKO B]|uniref:preprotein translocase subunit YajC n=1 Tax=Arcobacter sp. FWKO B TaxID=2593672 RepID=UPI0018A5A18B|nr:preprotein translocase subunit YajC [Arcobacter sp. FWKO B]QOG12103.1 preprotein translocase subunit YajC [Arcobacter sp. FWKO B]
MDGSLIGSLLPLIVLFAIFYFLIIRPQQQTAKKHKEMIENMKKGDKIVTSGGLIAEVVKVEDEFFRIKLADNTEVKIIKEYVARLVEENAK